MVYRKKNESTIQAYVYEAYKRLYRYAVDDNLYKIDFDRFHIETELYGLKFSYKDYYCPSKIQSLILDNLLQEEYIILPYKTKHKLREYEKGSIRASVSLGCSPFSSYSAFVKDHPSSKEKFEQYLTEEDIKELDKD